MECWPRSEGDKSVGALILYASRTGTRRNLEELRKFGWRLLVSAAGVWRHEGFRYALDNGAWSAFQKGQRFDGDKFLRCCDVLGAEADWIVLPDIVGGGLASLEMSLAWAERVAVYGAPLLLPVQDNMCCFDVLPATARFGLFLGGTTEWKEDTMQMWGDIARRRGCYYHVARVNTARRMRLALTAGAASVDGTSASRYAVTAKFLSNAARGRRGDEENT